MVVEKFERAIADYFGAPYAVAVDCCTHGVELSLRYTNAGWFECPNRTYLSIPMLSNKLDKPFLFHDYQWQDYYHLTGQVIDAAVLWKPKSYKLGTFMSLSFQYQKHLSLGRGGMILCETTQQYIDLKKLTYDGRLPNVPWREQDIDSVGYHYYMTPETAQLGLDKLPEAISTEPRKWVVTDWPDLTNMKLWEKRKHYEKKE